ncbi:MAG TPA: DUF2243 domain-containing protein [Solirubrobacterales bacterium]|nr:DUF2243 domain-containing protein [Solirubrobacterales bacterium]
MPRPSLAPGIVLGIGFGGFLDGIVLHQLLQWHHMVSAEGCCPANSLAGLEDNTTADGVFHAVTWLVALVGSLLTVRAWRDGRLAPPWLAHAGALLVGWGIFNLLDSLNHFVLGLHHVRDDLGGPLGWDLGFLAFALVLIGVGQAIARAALKREERSRRPQPRTPRARPAP